MHPVKCYNCKGFSHLVKDCSQKFYNYCKQKGHIITTCSIRPTKKQGIAYHASLGASCYATLPAQAFVPTPLADSLTQ